MEQSIAVVFVNESGLILLLKRAPHRKRYPNEWDALVGKVETGEIPEQCRDREIFEEIGVTEYTVVRAVEPKIYEDGNHKWISNLYVCTMRSDSTIVLNDEHTEYRWASIPDILRERCISPLLADLRRAFPESFDDRR